VAVSIEPIQQRGVVSNGLVRREGCRPAEPHPGAGLVALRGVASGAKKEIGGSGFVACALGRRSFNRQARAQAPIIEGCLAQIRGAGSLLSGLCRIA
jgi:hypothetical protein